MFKVLAHQKTVIEIFQIFIAEKYMKILKYAQMSLAYKDLTNQTKFSPSTECCAVGGYLTRTIISLD